MPTERLAQGLIQVYTGDGKGKTTCALGLAVRAVARGYKVAMLQFLKGRETGESQAALLLAPEMTLRFFGRPGLVNLKSPTPDDLSRVREAWEAATRVLAAGEHDLVILDEINLALAHGLIPLEEALAALSQRPPWVEVILTGRRAPQALLDLADLVTEMVPRKHYYQAGVRARRGIEW